MYIEVRPLTHTKSSEIFTNMENVHENAPEQCSRHQQEWEYKNKGTNTR